MLNKHKRKAMAAMAMMSLLLTGCSKGRGMTVNPEAKYYSVNIDGERMEIAEDDERIVALNDLATNFVPAIVDRNYKNPDVTSEYQWYTDDFAKTTKEAGRPETVLQGIQNNELLITTEELEVQKIQLFRYRNEPSASITVDYITRYEHAVEGYFESIGLKDNARYKRTMTISLLYQNDKWGVYDYSNSGRVEVK